MIALSSDRTYIETSLTSNLMRTCDNYLFESISLKV